MRFLLEILKTDKDDSNILIPVYGCDYLSQSKEFEHSSLDNFIRDIRALAEWCLDNGAGCFEAKIFSDAELLKDVSHDRYVLVTSEETLENWQEV